MRTRKLSKNLRKYAPGGFASATQTGLPEITPVYDVPTVEKNSAERAANVLKASGKGASVGASVGSFIPGVGTAVGAGVGAAIGAGAGLIGNRKAEKERQKRNQEIQRMNAEQRKANIDLWGQRAGMEADMNLNQARMSGYNTMGNVDQEFYGRKGGKAPKSNPFSYSFAEGGLDYKGLPLKANPFKYAEGGSTGYSQDPESIKAARQKPGGSNVGKYNPNQTFAGPSGGAPRGSYPIGDIGHAKSALKLAHNAPNPSGIKAAVYKKYPSLKHEGGGFSYKFNTGGLYQEGGEVAGGGPIKPRKGTKFSVESSDGTGYKYRNGKWFYNADITQPGYSEVSDPEQIKSIEAKFANRFIPDTSTPEPNTVQTKKIVKSTASPEFDSNKPIWLQARERAAAMREEEVPPGGFSAGGFSYKFTHGGALNSYEQGMRNLNEVKGQGFNPPFPYDKYYDSTVHLTNKGFKMPFQNGGGTTKGGTPPPTPTPQKGKVTIPGKPLMTPVGTQKPYHVTEEEIWLSQPETEYLNQFKDNPKLYAQARNEMLGYTPKRGTGTEATNLANYKRAIAQSRVTYDPNRQRTAPTTLAQYRQMLIDQEIAGDPGSTTKLGQFTKQTQEKTEARKDALQQEINRLAAENVAGFSKEDIPPSTFTPGQDTGLDINARKFGGPVYKKGGKLNGLNSNTYKAVGRTHEQGGIDLSRNAEIENKEVVTDKGDQYFITSAKLTNPMTGNTFAKDDEVISRKIGKLEGADDNRQNRNALKLLNMKKGQLHNMQQQMNGNYGEEGMEEQPQQQFNLGGTDPSWKKRQSGNRPYYFIPPPTMGMRHGGKVKYQYGTPSDELGQGTSIDLGQNVGGSGAYNTYSATPQRPSNLGPKRIGSVGFLQGSEPQAGGMFSGLGSKLGQAAGNVDWAGLGSQALSAIGNYAGAFGEYANQKKAIKRLEALKLPDPILQQYVNLGKMNLGVDRANVEKEIAASNKALERGLTDTNVAAAARAQNLASNLAAKAQINQQERNINQEIANRQQEVNLGIRGQNTAAQMARQQAEFDKQAQLIGMKSEAFSKLMENLRTGQNTAAAKRFAQNQFALDAYRLSPESRQGLGEYMKSRGGNLYGRPFRFGGRITHMYC